MDEPVTEGASIGIVLGRNVRTIRTFRGLTIAELSHASGYGRHSIGKLENDGVNVSFNNVRSLSKALNVPINILFSRDIGHDFCELSSSEKDGLSFMEDDFIAVFAQNVRRELLKQNRRQTYLQTSGLHSSHVNLILSGEFGNPRISTLDKLSGAVGRDLGDLLLRQIG